MIQTARGLSALFPHGCPPSHTPVSVYVYRWFTSLRAKKKARKKKKERERERGRERERERERGRERGREREKASFCSVARHNVDQRGTTKYFFDLFARDVVFKPLPRKA